eukprot:scaffold21846_cov51-Isochrysis_galbana.AAC.1
MRGRAISGPLGFGSAPDGRRTPAGHADPAGEVSFCLDLDVAGGRGGRRGRRAAKRAPLVLPAPKSCPFLPPLPSNLAPRLASSRLASPRLASPRPPPPPRTLSPLLVPPQRAYPLPLS